MTESAAAPRDPTRATALVSDKLFTKHDPGAGHPESPARSTAVTRALAASKFADRLVELSPRAAADQEIVRCHTAEYIAIARRDIESGATQLSTGDTAVCRESLAAAQAAAGGACVAVDAVCGGQAANAFCVVRPPGHHATPSRGMGFCIFNSVAVAARYAQHQHKVEKVLIVDWDVHHGNGTQDIFYEDPSVFFFSTHQSPWYPGTGPRDETGGGKGLGTTLNRPFPAGTDRKKLLPAWSEELRQAADRFRPQLVLVSAGFDSRLGDPLGRFRLTDEDFARLTDIVVDIARRHAAGRLVSVLEGGYNLDGLARAAVSHVGRLVHAAEADPQEP